MTGTDRTSDGDSQGRQSNDGPREPRPVVFATDIGTDVDDTWALAQLFGRPELDLRLVVTETGDPTYRASIAAKLLERADRFDVPLALGNGDSQMDEAARTQAPWIEGYDLGDYPGEVHEDGIDALAETVAAASQPVTVLSVAPTPTIAAAIDRDPELARQCRFVGMHGSFQRGYDGGDPDAETNVRVDPDAFRTVLSAPWQDVLLTPLDTCGQVRLTGKAYHRVWSATSDPVLRGVIENNCLFASRVPWMAYEDFTRRSSTLFDTAAVALAHEESWFEIERRSFDVTDDGFTIPDSNGAYEARIALEWADREGFETALLDALSSRG
ncbi:nucleoside hydrolase [Halorhabdus amylolytica]|uniref:nucleoside hydrolase n=1 Tax=Halorhabdus amylolytica TaxID=2559573 RepID=UPI0010A9D4F9|nr:nucleoside hydrolase [Halorhabdus amylolytica]